MAERKIDWISEEWEIEIVHEKPEGDWNHIYLNSDEIKIEGNFVQITRREEPETVTLIPITRVYRISQTQI